MPHVDYRSLLIGLSCVFAFYGLFFLYIASFSASTIESLEKNLATQKIIIERKSEKPVAEVIPQEKQSQTQSSLPVLVEGLYQKSAIGILPIKRETDGKTSFEAYKRPFSFSSVSNPILAVVVTDFGLSKSAAENAIDLLPPDVSYSLSPYADMAEEWAKILRQSGREFWINLPFEADHQGLSDSGPMTVYRSSGFVKNQTALHKTLASAQSYSGLSVSMGSTSIEDTQLRKIMDEVFGRGLGYLELDPLAKNSILNVAIEHNAPYVKADIELVFSEGSTPFSDLENILKSQGYAIAVISAYPNNIKRLAEWLIKVGQVDYALAPVSAIFEAPLHTNKKNMPAAVHAGQLRNEDKVVAPQHME